MNDTEKGRRGRGPPISGISQIAINEVFLILIHHVVNRSFDSLYVFVWMSSDELLTNQSMKMNNFSLQSTEVTIVEKNKTSPNKLFQKTFSFQVVQYYIVQKSVSKKQGG